MSILLLVPPEIQELNQQGAIERAFHDALVPNLAFRSEAMAEEWPANTGVQTFQTRPGLLAPKVTPLTPGSDPTPSQVIYEQWSTTLQQFADAIDTHMPTAITSNANLFLRNIHQLGVGAGMSINRIARNALFVAYLSGNSVLITAALSADTQIHVSALNGFTDVIVPGNNVAPKPVSPATPLAITLGVGSAASANAVVGFVPDNANDPVGPGTLFLQAAVGGSGFANRTSVLSANAATVVRSGGGATVDAISAADTLLLQDCINAVALLRNANVMPHEDGFYHAHISPLANAQIFADPVFQRLNTALPEGVMYSQGFVGHISGVLFFMNSEAPNSLNTGTRTFTGPTFAQYSPDIGAETTNDSGVNIGRVIITGKGALYERYLDESQYVTEAGTVGKIGTFDVVNNGISILTERIRLVLRAPVDRLQQVVSSAWSITTAFPVPSDLTAPSGPQRFKRAVVLEHAL
jgi:hypothetical protein